MCVWRAEKITFNGQLKTAGNKNAFFFFFQIRINFCSKPQCMSFMPFFFYVCFNNKGAIKKHIACIRPVRVDPLIK